MGTSHTVNALSDERAEIAGIILHLMRQLRVHRSELMQRDAAPRLLNPSIQPRNIRAKHDMAVRSGYFAMGEISQRCMKGLREGGENGTSPDELARKAMAEKELDHGDEAMRREFMRRFHWALARIQRDNRAERVGTGMECGGGLTFACLAHRTILVLEGISNLGTIGKVWRHLAGKADENDLARQINSWGQTQIKWPAIANFERNLSGPSGLKKRGCLMDGNAHSGITATSLDHRDEIPRNPDFF